MKCVCGGGGCVWVAFSVMVLFCLKFCTVCVYVFGRGIISCHKCRHVAAMYMCHAMYVTVTHIHTFMYYSAHKHTFMYSTGNTVDMLHW